jgi:hypothetical protein
VGVGDESTPDQLADRSAVALAAGLGIEPVPFPVLTAASPATRKPSPPGSTRF